MATSKSLLIISLLLPAILGLLAPCKAENVLYSGESLSGGQSLNYGSYTLIMQSDCNFVLYDSGTVVWSTQTNNKGSNCYVRMQTDRNLVVYDGNNKALWASNTYRSRSGNYVLVLQKDHNVVIYGPGVWATGTNGASTADVVIGNNSTEPVVKVSENIAMVTEN